MNNQPIHKNKNAHAKFTVSILEAILFFIITIFLGQIVAGIISAPTFFYPKTAPFLFPLSFLLGFGSVAFVLLLMKGMGLADVKSFLHKRINPLLAVLAILLYIVALPMAEYLSMLIPTDAHPLLEKLYKLFEESMQIIFDHKIAAFVMVCILAPLLEEFIFRGIILRGLLQKGVNPWFSIVFSGILFGAAHMNPWQFMGAGLLGIIFGFVYWRTKSLWLVIFLHFLNNFIAYVITLYNQSLEETVFEPNFMLLIGSLVSSILIGWFLYKKSYQQEIKPPLEPIDN